MRDRNLTDVPPTPRRRGRGCLLWLGGSALVVMGLLAAGAVYESRAEAADERDYPPPGKMVDVGGHRLHLDCTGAGSPTVVIDAGWGDWSTAWGHVQSEVAKTTRVCTYDRAGMGWSDPGPLPRDARQFARELHTLLSEARIPAPYVLVGHSLGGLAVRVYAHDHPSEVVGVVLVDSMSPNQFTTSAADTQDASTSMSRAFSLPVLLARCGAMRLFAEPLGLLSDVPPDVEAAYFARFVRPQHLQTYIEEGQGMPATSAQAAAVTTFGDLPLIVLSRGLDGEADWDAMQAEMLQLSSDSQRLVADKSGHNIELDQPEAAIAAIVTMVEAFRER